MPTERTPTAPHATLPPVRPHSSAPPAFAPPKLSRPPRLLNDKRAMARLRRRVAKLDDESSASGAGPRGCLIATEVPGAAGTRPDGEGARPDGEGARPDGEGARGWLSLEGVEGV